jgi:hypothetical protein
MFVNFIQKHVVCIGMAPDKSAWLQETKDAKRSRRGGILLANYTSSV